jgi:GT2 family glycosyltransferase
MPKVSILLSTIDRYELLESCIGAALRSAGYPYQLLWCDNGSTDRRVVDYMRTFNPVYERLNEKNEGCAQMHNQMLLRCILQYTPSDLFCLLDNDIEIRRDNWLKEMVETYEAIPESGIASIYSEGLGAEPSPVQLLHNIPVHPSIDVFGTRMFSRRVLGKVGYFDELSRYALCDNIYNCRVHYMGFTNYYLSGPNGIHRGADVGEDSDYRRMKDAEMKIAQQFSTAILERCITDPVSCYIPVPPLR